MNTLNPDMNTLTDVLRVVDEFASLGGASLELVAWELGAEVREVESVWRRALCEGMLEYEGIDHGESMWRLGESGRAALDRA
jgi:hypothetical protein